MPTLVRACWRVRWRAGSVVLKRAKGGPKMPFRPMISPGSRRLAAVVTEQATEPALTPDHTRSMCEQQPGGEYYATLEYPPSPLSDNMVAEQITPCRDTLSTEKLSAMGHVNRGSTQCVQRPSPGPMTI